MPMTSGKKATIISTTVATTSTRIGRKGTRGFRHSQIFGPLIKSSVIALLIFSPLALGSVHPWAYTLIEVVVLCLYLLWTIHFLGQNLQAKEPRWKLMLIKTPLNIPFCLIIGLIFFQLLPLPSWLIAWLSPSTQRLYVTTLATGGYEEAIRTLSISPWLSACEFFKLLTYIGVFYLVIYHFRNRLWLNRLIKAIVITGFSVAVVGLLQHFTTPKMIYGFRDASYASPFGPYINRNHFAGYMQMTIFIAMGLLLSKVLREGPPPGRWRAYLSEWHDRISKEVLLGFGVVLMAVALAFSLSRGGIVSSVVALVFMGSMMVIRKKRYSLTLFVVLLCFSLFYLLWLGIGPVIERLATVRYWDTLEVSRIRIWHGAVGIVRDFYPLGTGLGTFINIYPLYQTLETPPTYDHAHNDYIELFSELGVIGGILFWGAIILFVIRILSKWSERRYPYVVGICLGSTMGVVSLVLHSTVDFNLHIPANGLLFFTFFAVSFNTVLLRGEGASMQVIAPARDITIPSKWGRLLAFLFLCVIVLIAGSIIRNYLAERSLNEVRQKINLYNKGESPSWVDANTLSRLHKAQKLAPGNALPHYLLAKAYERKALASRGLEEQTVFFDIATREYRAAINLEPTNAWYHLGLGWVYLVLSERDHTLKEHAKKEFEIAERLAPNNKNIQRYLKKLYKSW